MVAARLNDLSTEGKRRNQDEKVTELDGQLARGTAAESYVCVGG